jgi:hypothetical protein
MGAVAVLLGVLRDPRVRPSAPAVACLEALSGAEGFHEALGGVNGPALLVRCLDEDDEESVVAATHFLRRLVADIWGRSAARRGNGSSAANNNEAGDGEDLDPFSDADGGGGSGGGGAGDDDPMGAAAQIMSHATIAKLVKLSLPPDPSRPSHAQYGAMSLLECIARTEGAGSVAAGGLEARGAVVGSMIEHGVVASLAETLGAPALPLRRAALSLLAALLPSPRWAFGRYEYLGVFLFFFF